MPVQVRRRARAGSLPPVKARRRQNAIDNLNAVSKAASRSGARRDGRSQRDFESLKKSAPHLLARTLLLTPLRVVALLLIKAETATSGRDINNAGLRCRCAAATGETGIAETGRAGTRFSSGAKGFGGI